VAGPDNSMTATTAKALKALLASRRVLTPSPASESGGVAARYLLGRDQVAPPPDGNGAGPAAPTARFVDRGGLVIKDLDLWLIFWGSAWAAGASPTAPEITDAAKTMLGGAYLTGLAQYRGIHGAAFKGAIQVTDSDPPNPFSNSAITNMLHQQLGKGALPEPDEDPSILYCVILPPGVNAAEPGVVGEHSFYLYFDLTDLALPPDFDIARAHYAWVSNDGSLDSITTVLSHELVESCTDPNGDAIQGVPGTCNQTGWCEIGDVCGWSEVRDGMRVQAYWSEADQACIIPGVPVATSLSTPDGPATNGGTAVAPTLRAETVAGMVSVPASPPRSELGARFAGGLLATAWLAPIVAAIVTVAAYVVLNQPASGLPATLAGLSVGVALWLLLAAFYAPMACARGANSSSYADLQERLCRLDARLAAVPAASRTSSFAEAVQHRNFIAAELETCGTRWVSAIGYISLWNRMHRAEEALIEVEPRTQVLADALYDQWRIQDSTIDHSTELLGDLQLAQQYLVTLRVADGATTQAIRTETEARAVVEKVRNAINDFRDKRRAGLVRARNLLMWTMIITELFALALLALAVINRAPQSAIIAAIVFYLVGAVVGLFNRLGQQVSAGTMVEDYSLAGIRLVLTPTLSGLAAVGGVVLTGMLAMSGLVTLTQPSGGAAAPLNLPALADIFDLNKFRIGLPLAALFGSTPALLSRRLQSLTDQYKDDLKSTDPSSAAPAPKRA